MSHRRSRSRPQVFETAFVTSAGSSVEDLDQVDRIANHPLLQTRRLNNLPKSRSAMGGSVDRGASAFLADYSPEVNQRMSRSTTLHLTSGSMSCAAQVSTGGGKSGATSTKTTPSSEHWNFSWRPKSALTRIMRITKPRSCDNILDESRRQNRCHTPPSGYHEASGSRIAISSCTSETPPINTWSETPPPVTNWRHIPISRSANNILSSAKTPPPKCQPPPVSRARTGRHSAYFVPKSFSNDNLLYDDPVHVDSPPGFSGRWKNCDGTPASQYTPTTPATQYNSKNRVTTCSVTVHRSEMNPGSRVVHIEPSIKSQASHASTPHSRPGGGHQCQGGRSSKSPGGRSSRSPVSRGATPSSLDGLNTLSRSREESPLDELEKYDESPGANIRRGFDLVNTKKDNSKTCVISTNTTEYKQQQQHEQQKQQQHQHAVTTSNNAHKSVLQLKHSYLMSTSEKDSESPKFSRSSEVESQRDTNYSSDSAPGSREMSPFPVAKKSLRGGIMPSLPSRSHDLFKVNIPTPPGTAPAQKRIISIHRDGSSYQYHSPRIGSDTNVFRLSELRQSSSAESTPQRTAAGPRFRNRRRGGVGVEVGGGGGKFKGSRFGSSTSSSCISSWESIHSSNSSQGYGSEALSTCTVAGPNNEDSSTGDQPWNSGSGDLPRLKRLHNLNILSPISDKSGDQISPSSDKEAKESKDNNANNVSTSDDEVLDNNFSQHQQQNKDGNSKQTRNLNLNLNLNHQSMNSSMNCDNLQTVAALKNLRTPDIQHYLNVPWDMPKLKKKLQYRRSFCFGGSENSSPDVSPKKSNTQKPLDVKINLDKRCGSQGSSPMLNSSVEPMSMSGSYSEAFSNEPLPNNCDNSPISKDRLVMRPKRFPKQKGLDLYSKCGEGSDSGISISSQEIKELLDVPWSMPKLKRNAWLRTKPPRDGLALPIPKKSSTTVNKPVEDDSVVINNSAATSIAAINNSIENITTHSICDTTITTRRDDDNIDAKDNSSDYNIPVSIINTAVNPPDQSLPFSMPKLERRLKARGVVLDHKIQLSGPPGADRVPGLGLKPDLDVLSSPEQGCQLDTAHEESMFSNESFISGRKIEYSSEAHLNTSHRKPPTLPKMKPVLSLPVGEGKSAPSLPLFTATGGGDFGGGGIRERAGLPPIPQLSFGFNMGADVDASLPLESQGWYHGILSKSEVESVLRSRDEGSYLVRSAGEGDYALAIKSAKGFIHLRMRRRKGEAFSLGEEEREFASVVDIVKHYSLNRLPIKGAEHLSLLTPATQELL